MESNRNILDSPICTHLANDLHTCALTKSLSNILQSQPTEKDCLENCRNKKIKNADTRTERKE